MYGVFATCSTLEFPSSTDSRLIHMSQGRKCSGLSCSSGFCHKTPDRCFTTQATNHHDEEIHSCSPEATPVSFGVCRMPT